MMFILVNGENQRGARISIDGLDCTPGIRSVIDAGATFWFAGDEQRRKYTVTEPALANRSGQVTIEIEPSIETARPDNEQLIFT